MAYGLDQKKKILKRFHDGEEPRAIAASEGVSAQTIRKWAKADVKKKGRKAERRSEVQQEGTALALVDVEGPVVEPNAQSEGLGTLVSNFSRKASLETLSDELSDLKGTAEELASIIEKLRESREELAQENAMLRAVAMHFLSKAQ